MRTTEKAISYYRQSVIRHIEKRFRKASAVSPTSSIAVYLSSAADEDIKFWAKHFGACARSRFGYVVFGRSGGKGTN